MDDAASHILEAILHGRTDIVKLLLAEVRKSISADIDKKHKLEEEFDTFVNTKWSDSRTFLQEAVIQGHRDIIRTLLNEGGDPSVICKITNAEATFEENALQTAKRLDDSSGTNSLNGLSHVFEEMLFQVTASSR